MFDFKYLVLVAAMTAVTAMMLPRGSALSIDLSAMINKTVCAIEVKSDVDPDRIPQRIKMITCAADTNRACVANRIGQHHCCHHENKMECVEMRDTVLVFNKKLNESQTIEVSVGCACMIRGSSAAVSLDRPAR